MHDMVVFGEDWGRHPSSTQHLVKRLAVGRRVLWVNSIGMRRPRFTVGDLERAASKVLAAWHKEPASQAVASSCDEVPAGLSRLSPLVATWPGSRTAFAVNRLLLTSQITCRMQALGIDRPVLWTSLPTALPVVGNLGERALVYYCGDDFGSLVGVDHAPVLEMERQLVAKADLVLAASEVLAERFPASKTLHLPHGADIGLFATPAPRPRDLPDGRPIAGFYGSISDWIDINLLAAVADALPDWWIVMIGQVETDVSALLSRANIRLLGKRAHGELPGYCQHWTVSMLPFRDTPQVRACNPLKLREYLASGRPVVATEFPALAPYRDLVSVAAGAAAFSASISQAEFAVDHTAKRRARVQGETWEARAEKIEQALEGL